MTFWIPIVALLILCPILYAKSLRQAEKNGDIERLNEATDELKRTLREAFEPPLLRLVTWLNHKLK